MGRPRKSKALVTVPTDKECIKKLEELLRISATDNDLLSARNRVLKGALKKAQWQASARGIMVAGLEAGVKQLRQLLADSGEEVPLEVYLSVTSEPAPPVKPRGITTQWRVVDGPGVTAVENCK